MPRGGVLCGGSHLHRQHRAFVSPCCIRSPGCSSGPSRARAALVVQRGFPLKGARRDLKGRPNWPMVVRAVIPFRGAMPERHAPEMLLHSRAGQFGRAFKPDEQPGHQALKHGDFDHPLAVVSASFHETPGQCRPFAVAALLSFLHTPCVKNYKRRI